MRGRPLSIIGIEELIALYVVELSAGAGMYITQTLNDNIQSNRSPEDIQKRIGV